MKSLLPIFAALALSGSVTVAEEKLYTTDGIGYELINEKAIVEITADQAKQLFQKDAAGNLAGDWDKHLPEGAGRAAERATPMPEELRRSIRPPKDAEPRASVAQFSEKHLVIRISKPAGNYLWHHYHDNLATLRMERNAELDAIFDLPEVTKAFASNYKGIEQGDSEKHMIEVLGKPEYFRTTQAMNFSFAVYEKGAVEVEMLNGQVFRVNLYSADEVRKRREHEDPILFWETAQMRPVSPVAGRHSIHSYYLTSPESPDGKYVLFFTSIDPTGEVGEVRIVERATGKETVLAENVHTEDAHRVACQQWLGGGKIVAYHEVIDKKWRVVAVDVASGKKTIVAEDRQVGFGRAEGDLLPLYGCHWNPGEHRDLEIWDARTGKLHTAVTMESVQREQGEVGEMLKKTFDDKPVSIFFPVISPDLKRAFFKLAAGSGGEEFQSKQASQRAGLICCDLESSRLIWSRAKWGHPSWHPDSRRIFEMGNLMFDTQNPSADAEQVETVPALSGQHPSVSPDGKLMVTDGLTKTIGGPEGQCGIIVGGMTGGRWTVVARFDGAQGAKSWRKNHAHPVFSADGMRIYYNVNDGPYTRLFVAERKPL